VSEGTGWSKYVLRIELDMPKMFDKNITMDDILYVLRRRFEEEINIVYSDFNSHKLIMRIRLSTTTGDKTDPASLDMMSQYKKFQNKLLNSVIVRGVPGIKGVTFRKGEGRLMYNAENKKYEQK
jgi:hypothetical protein